MENKAGEQPPQSGERLTGEDILGKLEQIHQAFEWVDGVKSEMDAAEMFLEDYLTPLAKQQRTYELPPNTQVTFLSHVYGEARAKYMYFNTVVPLLIRDIQNELSQKLLSPEGPATLFISVLEGLPVRRLVAGGSVLDRNIPTDLEGRFHAINDIGSSLIVGATDGNMYSIRPWSPLEHELQISLQVCYPEL